MAGIAMAYLVMACILMACKVMAYTVMASTSVCMLTNMSPHHLVNSTPMRPGRVGVKLGGGGDLGELAYLDQNDHSCS